MTTTAPPIAAPDFIKLERISRKAAQDSLRARHAHIHEDDRFDSLALHLLETGIRAWNTYDPDLAGGVSQETHAYRMMRGRRGGTLTDGPYIDWVRRTVRDARFEPDIVTVLTADGLIPDRPSERDDPLDTVIASLAPRLGETTRWALEQIARRMANDDLTLAEAANAAGVDPAFAEIVMRSLADELRPGWKPNSQTSIGILEFAAMAAA